MITVRQGETFDFEHELDGTGATGFTVTYSVMQYPGDTPSITGTMTLSDCKYIGTLTAVQTAALDVGQWFIYMEAVDSDEDLHEILKFYLAKGWT